MNVRLLVVAIFFTLLSSINVKAQDTDAITNIDDIWLEHNVYHGNAKGMIIHISFTIENMKGRSIQVGAYFFDSYGNPVKANNVPMQYRTRDGQLCSGSQAYVKYESTSWEDYKLFIPNGYFRDGEYSCAVQISSNRGIVLAVSDSVSFTKSSY